VNARIFGKFGGIMQSNMRPEDEGTASLNLGFDLAPAAGESAGLRLRPSVARGITGRWCGAADLFLLSATLIYFALWAGSVELKGNLVTLFSIRMSVGHFVMLALCWLVWRRVFIYCGLYTWQHVQSAKGLLGRVVLATGLCALVSGQVVASFWHHGKFLQVASYCWLIGTGCALVSRVSLGAFYLYVKPLLRRGRNAVVVGSGARAASICDELRSNPEWKYKFLGYVESKPREASGPNGQMLGRITDLEEILMKQVVDEVIIALPVKSQYGAIERVISVCERVGIQVQYWEDLFEGERSAHCYRDELDHRRVVLKMVQDDYRHQIKRALDIVGAAFGLILCAPLFALVAVLIKCTSEGPVFFKQERYGLSKRTFFIYKFRTMVINAEAAQAALEHMNQNSGPVFKIFSDPRITKLGAFLRKTSIDELPQLFNVLKGEMSLVGPRPLNLRDVGRFSEAWLMRRFSVKPGLTCLWQVSGRSNVSFDRWIELDLHYIDHWSLRMDMKILAMTLPAVLRGTGAA
jgi:exopolysaccharide biosynthesis polyprenyl glycosylphosphotransferase